MSFIKGDRVKYTGNGSYNTPGLFGKLGTVKTVEHVHNPIVFVTWDDPDAYPNGVYPANLEKVVEPVAPAFNPGDRVRYTGKSPLTNEPHRVGWLGTVKEVESKTNVRVKWVNSGFVGGHFPENLELEKVKPMNVSNTSTAPAPAQALRDRANMIEEISLAWQDVADKLRDSADAMEHVSDLIENVSDLINADTNNL